MDTSHTRRRWLAWAIPVVVLLIAIAIPNLAPPPAELSRIDGVDGRRFGTSTASTAEAEPGLSETTRRSIFRDIAANDGRWRGFAERSFPRDEWAQADHWTDHMSQYARYLAGRYDVSVAAILLTYDEGLHKGWRSPKGTALRTTWPPLQKRKR